MDEDALRKGELQPPLLQRPDEVLPDHVGKAEEKHRTIAVLLLKGQYPLHIQLHILI